MNKSCIRQWHQSQSLCEKIRKSGSIRINQWITYVTISITITKEQGGDLRTKMAVGTPIRVCVLEGLYGQLATLGFSHLIAMELQSRGLRPESAVWTMRHSTSGFLISLFWPGYQNQGCHGDHEVESSNHADAEDVKGGDLGPLILLSVTYAGLLPQLQSIPY